MTVRKGQEFEEKPSSGILELLAILPGRQSGYLPEVSCEMTLVVESGLHRDLADRLGSPRQEMSCLLDAKGD